MKIISLLKSILPEDAVVKSTNVIKTLKQTKETSIAPQFTSLAMVVKGLPDAEQKKVLNIIQKAGFKFPNANVALLQLASFLDEIDDAIDYAIDEISEDDIYAINNLTPKQAGILAVTQDIVVVSELMTDLALVIPYIIEGKDALYKNKIDNLIRALRISLPVIQYLYKQNASAIIKEITKLSDKTDNVSVKDANTFIPTVHQFTGNPLYHARKVWVDITFSRYEKRKTAAELTMLKIAGLEAQLRHGSTDTRLELQIEILEKQLIILDKKIKKYEEA